MNKLADLNVAKTTGPHERKAPQVLIVEDSATSNKHLHIERLGILVERVDTLVEALGRLEKPGIDVVLLDLFLPDSTGLITFNTIHSLSPLVPVVVLTALDDQTFALEAVKSGAQDYLIKGRASDDSVVRCLRYAIERQHVESALRESEHRTRLIIENSLDAFVSVDSLGRIIEWNHKAEEIFGWPRIEALGKHVSEFISPAALKGWQPHDLERIISHESDGILNKRKQVKASHKSGREFPIEYAFFCIKDKDKDKNIYCSFISDITERKEIEHKRKQIRQELESMVQERTADLEQSNEELRQFAKVASHDLQEPLRAIQGFAKLFAQRYKDKLDKSANEFIDFMLDGTERMQRLIESVLAHSRIDTEVVEKDVPFTDVDSVIKEVLANLNQSIKESGATFDIGQMPTIGITRSHLIQLFQNLISNAIKYAGDKPPHITIAAELSVNEWLFSVQDNGIGIDNKYAEKIFDMFARLHGQTKYAGTGMGLAICKKIVNVHSGRIWMESEPGEGSIFFFTLPISPRSSNTRIKAIGQQK